MAICGYCGKDNDGKKYCPQCGGPQPADAPRDFLDGPVRYEPFFYEGYIVYCLRDHMTRWVEIQFWLGHDLIERFRFDEEVLEWRLGKHATDDKWMQFFYECLQLAQGQTKVMEVKAMNMETRRIETFEIRLKPDPKKSKWLTLSMQEIAEASRQ